MIPHVSRLTRDRVLRLIVIVVTDMCWLPCRHFWQQYWLDRLHTVLSGFRLWHHRVDGGNRMRQRLLRQHRRHDGLRTLSRWLFLWVHAKWHFQSRTSLMSCRICLSCVVSISCGLCTRIDLPDQQYDGQHPLPCRLVLP
jgi:hypothetical protein